MHLDDPKTRARFEAKVDRSGPCHVWTAAHIPSGHGVFWLPKPDKKLAYAHRIALEQRLGRALASDEMATHTCDNPPCVNPDHLEPGDQKKNMGDAAGRDRVMHGSGHYGAKLKERDVREIRALLTVPGLRHADIAARYSVSRAVVTNIKNGKSWKRVS
jgi:hypothetical protein